MTADVSQNIKAAILGIGNEITNGIILNQHAQTLSQALIEAGVEPRLHLATVDTVSDIVNCLTFASQSHSVLLLTGGLGPTSDDLTRQAVASWLGRALVWSSEAWEVLNEILKKRGGIIRETHRHQCSFPEGALRFENHVGTAQGFGLEWSPRKWLYCLPGPTAELRSVWERGVMPHLISSYPTAIEWKTFVLHLRGVGESLLASEVGSRFSAIPHELSYRLFDQGLELRVTALNEVAGAVRSEIEALCSRFSENLITRQELNIVRRC